nr:MAG: hypothetical protein [Bacteriophage sp.]
MPPFGVAFSFGDPMTVFISNGSDPMVEVRLPAETAKDLKTRVLLGIKTHEVIVPNVWIDEVNDTFPHILLPVDIPSITFTTLYNSFTSVKFKTR